MTHLWIFKIHPEASYTGGMLLITADSFEQCQELWLKDTSKEDWDVHDAIKFALEASTVKDLEKTWIFERAFQVAGEPGWICWEYANG